jgi:2-dehydro-3-deoxygalactonokinase
VEAQTLRIIAEIQSEDGVGALAARVPLAELSHCFEKVLASAASRLVSDSDRQPDFCVVSGMASSNLGWNELPYAQVPLRMRAENLVSSSMTIEVADGGKLHVIFISGLRTDRNIMRGEECEVLGLIELVPEIRRMDSACLVLPGTHSKHVWLEGDVMVRFSTHMTGELYAHLQSMPTLATVFSEDETFSEEAFLAGVDEVRDVGLAAAMFQIRARKIISNFEGGRAFLSGALIGAELSHIPARAAFVIGSPLLAGRYAMAGERLGIAFDFLPENLVQRASVKAHALVLDEYASLRG